MDPQTDLPDLVEDLEVNIDELSDILSPLLTTSLSTTASSLPLLDKAKLYVLAAYSVESLLYSTLQASGVNAKEHAIFKELARLKGYFAKIKQAEERMTAPAAPKAKLDVGAAARFIRHGLAGNDKYDLERAERMAKEKARAQLKARQINKKFDGDGEEKIRSVTPQKRPVEEVDFTQPEQDDEEVLEGPEEPSNEAGLEQPAAKKSRLSEVQPMDIESAPSPAASSSSGSEKKRIRDKKTKSIETFEVEVENSAPPVTENAEPDTPTELAKERRTPRGKKGKPSSNETTEANEQSTLPTRVPKTRSKTFNTLLDGSLPEKQKRSRGRSKKAK